MVDLSDNIDNWVLDHVKWFISSVFKSFNSSGGTVISGLRYGLVIFGETAEVSLFITSISMAC